jgi:hypothetical protein
MLNQPGQFRELTTSLTHLKPNFDERLRASGDDRCVPADVSSAFSNDQDLPASYRRAAALEPRPSPGMVALRLISGNGSIITAPVKPPVMQADFEPVALEPQIVGGETFSRLPTPDTFLQRIDAYNGELAERTGQASMHLREGYERQRQVWNRQAGEAGPRHFLTDQAAYDAARQRWQPPAYRDIDFLNRSDLRALARDLDGVAEITMANLTNTFTPEVLGPDCADAADQVLDTLPIADGAVIMHADRNNPSGLMLSRAVRVEEWRDHLTRRHRPS